jgi:hypothetical protein
VRRGELKKKERKGRVRGGEGVREIEGDGEEEGREGGERKGRERERERENMLAISSCAHDTKYTQQ